MALRQFGKDYYKQFIPKSGIPDRVFKYATVNDSLKDSLREGYLWFSKPDDFNDPFDCWTALVDFSQPKDYLEKLVDDRFPHLNRRDRRAKKRIVTNDLDKASNVYKALTHQTMQMMGVCCFTLNDDHILMWSHYANNHRGLCLEFEPVVDLAYFLTAEVKYSDQFDPLNYFSSEDDALMIMVLTKSTVWSYEREIRIMRPMENGKMFFKRPALKGVIFGCRTSEKDIRDIRSIMSEHGYRDIRYRQASMATDSFKLILSDI